MKLSMEEIAEELASLQEILHTLHRRRRELQKKHAVRGLDTPAEVLIEIEDMTKQIHAYEEEIAQFEARAAADQVPVEEIEYQAMLAEEWDKCSGRLKLAQRARLDWARVRLGIALERAQVMEHTVRTQMAEELFEDLNLRYLPHHYENVPPPPWPFAFDKLRKAILLDLPTAIQSIRGRFPVTPPIDVAAVGDALMDPDSTCRQDDSDQYQRFLNEVRSALS